ncbi:origin recognition complex subunit 4 C-terminus-domain-containing protein [Rhypophila decipiens]|uniref:Origin recognition complex subunit 4 C-terminus-domain-containing protein n=1 Tax=Rhypophila decipiens TaxID=261697 RepID=A0AAN6Y8Z0_9PEZI|nr:origin recognition complex subunit 4 C-terminus-domain-containing protein [Rhypophila decipiens]
MAKKKENTAPKGGNKRARSTNEDESLDLVSSKKQRVQEDTASQEETSSSQSSAIRRSASTRVKRPTSKFAIEDVLAAPEPRQKSKTPRQQPQKKETQPVTTKKTKPQSQRGGKKAPREILIYDEDELTDDEMDAPPVTRKRTRAATVETTTATASPDPVEEEDRPPKKRRGRPPKSQVSSKASAQSAAASPAPAVSIMQPSKPDASKDSTATEEEPIKVLEATKVPSQKDHVNDSQPLKGIPTPSNRVAVGKSRLSAAFSWLNNIKSTTDDQAAPESSSPSITSISTDTKESTVSPEVPSESPSFSVQEEPKELTAKPVVDSESPSPSNSTNTEESTENPEVDSESPSFSIQEEPKALTANPVVDPESPSPSISINTEESTVSPEADSEAPSLSIQEDPMELTPNPAVDPESPSPSIQEDPMELTPNLEVDPEPQPEPESGGSEEMEQESHEDDQVCSVCSKPDSKPGNEILLCDGDECSVAAHQKCYDVAVIPKGDWYCRACSEKRADNTKQIGKESTADSAEVVTNIPNFKHHLKAMQRVLLDRCNGKKKIKLINMDEVYEKVYQVVDQTIEAGEGNSMLVIGGRGSGKTTVMDKVMSTAKKEHKDDFHMIWLTGFMLDDDKRAMKEIWTQLGREMEVDEELLNKTTSYQDTMASLIALLSHPTEISGDAQDGVTSKSVIFVLDEFELFAAHPRQTLLYNLFDIAQAKKAPIAVIGLTTKIDVVEILEKRVKSRFSHRYVFLSPPRSLPAYWEVCRQGFTVDDEDMMSEGIDVSVRGHTRFWNWWNEQVEKLRKTRAFQNRLEYQYYTTKSVMAFLRGWIVPLSLLDTNFPTLKPPGPIQGLEYPHSKLPVLEALSDLDLSMLIAAARLEIIANTEVVNFSTAYDEYTRLMAQQRVQSANAGMFALGGAARVWGRDVALGAWQRLHKLELLVDPTAAARTTTTGSSAAGMNEGKMFKVDVALEEIPGAVKLNAVLAKWCTGL